MDRNSTYRFNTWTGMAPQPLKVLTAMLTVSWGGGAGSVRIAMPHADGPADVGIEELRFSDGSVLTRPALLTAAGPYDLNPHARGTTVNGTDIDGEAGDDTLSGSGMLRGGVDNDSLTGGSGRDALTGDEGADTLIGGAGADLLGYGIREFLGAGNTLRGGTGNDILLGSQGRDVFWFDVGDGADSIGDYWHNPGNSPKAQGIMTYGANSASAYSFAGGWTANYRDGENYGVGLSPLPVDYTGLDTLRLGSGITPGNLGFVRVAALNYALAPDPSPSATFSATGDDLVLTLGGSDMVRLVNWYKVAAEWTIDEFENPVYLPLPGGWNNDPLGRVEFADTTVWTRAYLQARSSNAITGTSGIDTLTGTGGSDWISTGAGSDTLNGLAGDDVLLGGEGNDTISGGEGNDTADFSSSAGSVIASLVTGQVSNDGTGGVDTLSGIENLTGGRGNDSLAGDAGANVLEGAAGSDTLNGDAGADTLSGGMGNDIYFVDDSGDVVTEFADEGTDTVHSSVSYTLSATLENLTLIGSGAINGTGNELANTMVGNQQANRLVGGAGDDVLDHGGGGADTLEGGTGNDRYLSDGVDDVILDYDATPGNVDTLVLPLESWSVLPNAYNPEQRIRREREGDDLILTPQVSWNGEEESLGSVRIRSYFVSSAYEVEQLELSNDIMSVASLVNIGYGYYGRSGNDNMVAGSGNDRLFGLGGDDTYDGGAGSDQIYDQAGNSSLFGGAGADGLYGDAGMDTLDGGTGNDHLSGGTGNDTYVFSRGHGSDVVNEWASADITTIRLAGVVSADAHVRFTRTGTTGDDLRITFADSAADMLTVARWWQGDEATWAVQFDNLTITRAGVEARLHLTGGAAADTIHGAGQSDIITGAGSNDKLYGWASADALHGDGGNDQLYGGDGDDTLNGGDGNDVLDGGLGADTLRGGAGDDSYFVDDAGDTIEEAVGGGYDTVYSGLDHWALGEGGFVESLGVLWSGPAGRLDGNSVANQLSGNAQANLLRGFGGADALTGQGGNDVLQGVAGADSLNSRQNYLSGNAVLDGGDDADSLTSDAGSDFLAGGRGGDALEAGAFWFGDGYEYSDWVGSTGRDIVAINRGDGADQLRGGSGYSGSETPLVNLSLGGGIGIDDLKLRKSAGDLVLELGGTDSLTMVDWYRAGDALFRSVANLQVIADKLTQGTWTPGSGALRDNRVERFDFQGIVADFDVARQSNAALNEGSASWQVTETSLAARLTGGSDSQAIGGNLAYLYAHTGSLTGAGYDAVRAITADSTFGATPQAFSTNLSTLQTGAVRLA